MKEAKSGLEITLEAEEKLAALFDAEISYQREVESLKVKFSQCIGSDASLAFDEMVLYSGDETRVDKRGVEVFLCAKGYTPNRRCVAAIMRRLDQNVDGYLSRQEMLNFMDPAFPPLPSPQKPQSLSSYLAQAQSPNSEASPQVEPEEQKGSSLQEAVVKTILTLRDRNGVLKDLRGSNLKILW